ncbi:MAG: GH3 family domain-containing protein [Candidatus Heimdallarchaeota archaeon]
MISRIILKAAQIALRKYNKMLKDPMVYQEKVISNILKENKDTVFGQIHNFSSINNIRSYQKHVAVGCFTEKKEYFEHSQESDFVLSKEPVIHWVQSSGTTGTPKILPMTDEGLKQWSAGSSRQFYAFLCDEPGNEKVLDGKIFAYAGQAELDRIRNVPLGYVSGATSSRVTNPILLKRLIPPKEILNVSEWKERYWKTMMNVVSHDVSVITGIPPIILGFLRAVQTSLPFQIDQVTDLKTQTKVKNAIFADTIDFEMLWPNLKYMASSGMIVDSYRSTIKDMLGDITILEMYAASEGHFGFQMHKDEPGLYLNFDNYLFEFRDLEDPDEVLLLNEVKKNTSYEMIISSSSGYYRYSMKDVVKFISLDPPKILVQGRMGNILNVGNEKVSEDQLVQVMNQAMIEIDGSSVDFILSGTTEFPVRHQIYIEMATNAEKVKKNADLLADIYDELMKKTNSCYDVSRLQMAIESPEIHILKKGTFKQISEENAKEKGNAAQTKLLHIVQPEKIKKIIEEEMIEYSYAPKEE